MKAIVHLVSHSVQGLTPENVTVVDSSGKVLSDLLNQDLFIYSKSGDGHTVSSVQRELERQQERELEGKVRMMLERVYGPERSSSGSRWIWTSTSDRAPRRNSSRDLPEKASSAASN